MSKTLYRIVQEALTNIRKYAQATQVNIQLSTTKDDVNLVIEDDGQGFDPNQQSNTGFGLQGMRERVAAVGGTLRLETEPGDGCRIIIQSPLHNHANQTEGNSNGSLAYLQST
jgi:signal transduction histidine kinase